MNIPKYRPSKEQKIATMTCQNTHEFFNFFIFSENDGEKTKKKKKKEALTKILSL